MAAILPKREHAIYKGALKAEPIKLPRDTSKVSPVQLTQAEAQDTIKQALNGALKRLRDKMKLNSDKKIMKDDVLLRKFQELDKTGDARVDQKELEVSSPKLSLLIRFHLVLSTSLPHRNAGVWDSVGCVPACAGLSHGRDARAHQEGGVAHHELRRHE